MLIYWVFFRLQVWSIFNQDGVFQPYLMSCRVSGATFPCYLCYVERVGQRQMGWWRGIGMGSHFAGVPRSWFHHHMGRQLFGAEQKLLLVQDPDSAGQQWRGALQEDHPKVPWKWWVQPTSGNIQSINNQYTVKSSYKNRVLRES